MSQKLYSLRNPKDCHMITIANSEEEAKMIFRKKYNKEPIEISIFDTMCSLSLQMSCKWCEDRDSPYCCDCGSIICVNKIN